MMLIVRWFINALALMAVAYLYPGVAVDNITVALVAALVLGLVNAVIRPILIVLTLPATVLTLGLFIFVINALLFWLVGELVPGFKVNGFMAALIGSILFSIISLLTNALVGTDRKQTSK